MGGRGHRVSWDGGLGGRYGGHWRLTVPVARVAFEQIPASRHMTQKSALVFLDLLVFFLSLSLSLFRSLFLSDHCFIFWLKLYKEGGLWQLGFSKQVRGCQHSSEVFSFPFYRRNLHWTHIKVIIK